MLLNNSQIDSLIKKLWDRLWSGGIANPLTAIEQITYLLFMKRLDDLDLKRQKESKSSKIKYVSKFKGKFKIPGTDEEIDKQKLRWSQFRQLPDDEILNFVQTKVFPFVKSLNAETSPFTRTHGECSFYYSESISPG